MRKIDQKIYALRLTDEEARALLGLLGDQCTSRALARVFRRLERIVHLIGDEQ